MNRQVDMPCVSVDTACSTRYSNQYGSWQGADGLTHKPIPAPVVSQLLYTLYVGKPRAASYACNFLKASRKCNMELLKARLHLQWK